jgi:DNA polymerase III subunit epsilon
MKKVLFFDVETTGLESVKNDIIQLSGIVEIDGKSVEEFNYKCQPFSYENIDAKALEVNKVTLELLKTFELPGAIHQQFTALLSKHCEKFDKTDKFYPAGYNVKFDIDFLAKWFQKNNDKYLGSWINWKALDPLPVLYMMDFDGKISLPDYHLVTVCNHFGISIEGAHDALIDIKATRELFYKLKGAV